MFACRFAKESKPSWYLIGANREVLHMCGQEPRRLISSAEAGCGEPELIDFIDVRSPVVADRSGENRSEHPVLEHLVVECVNDLTDQNFRESNRRRAVLKWVAAPHDEFCRNRLRKVASAG